MKLLYLNSYMSLWVYNISKEYFKHPYILGRMKLTIISFLREPLSVLFFFFNNMKSTIIIVLNKENQPMVRVLLQLKGIKSAEIISFKKCKPLKNKQVIIVLDWWKKSQNQTFFFKWQNSQKRWFQFISCSPFTRALFFKYLRFFFLFCKLKFSYWSIQACTNSICRWRGKGGWCLTSFSLLYPFTAVFY